MSIWSKNHEELAKLAQTLQDRNVQTRQRLGKKTLGTWPTDRLGASRSKSDSSLPSSTSPVKNGLNDELSFDISNDDSPQPWSRLRMDSFSSGDSAISPDFPRSSYPSSPILKQSRFTVNGVDHAKPGTLSSSPKNLDKKVTFLLGDESRDEREQYSVTIAHDLSKSLSYGDSNSAPIDANHGAMWNNLFMGPYENQSNVEVDTDKTCDSVNHYNHSSDHGEGFKTDIKHNDHNGFSSFTVLEEQLVCVRYSSTKANGCDENDPPPDVVHNRETSSPFCREDDNTHLREYDLNDRSTKDGQMTNGYHSNSSDIQKGPFLGKNDSSNVVVSGVEDVPKNVPHAVEMNHRGKERTVPSSESLRHFYNGSSSLRCNERIPNVGVTQNNKDISSKHEDISTKVDVSSPKHEDNSMKPEDNSTKQDHVEVSAPLSHEREGDDKSSVMNKTSTLNISEDLNLLLISLLTNHRKEQMFEKKRNGPPVKHDDDTLEYNEKNIDNDMVSNVHEVLKTDTIEERYESCQRLQHVGEGTTSKISEVTTSKISEVTTSKISEVNGVMNGERIGNSTGMFPSVTTEVVTTTDPVIITAIDLATQTSVFSSQCHVNSSSPPVLLPSPMTTASQSSTVWSERLPPSGTLPGNVCDTVYNELNFPFSHSPSSSVEVTYSSSDSMSVISLTTSEHKRNITTSSFEPVVKAVPSTLVYTIPSSQLVTSTRSVFSDEESYVLPNSISALNPSFSGLVSTRVPSCIVSEVSISESAIVQLSLSKGTNDSAQYAPRFTQSIPPATPINTSTVISPNPLPSLVLPQRTQYITPVFNSAASVIPQNPQLYLPQFLPMFSGETTPKTVPVLSSISSYTLPNVSRTSNYLPSVTPTTFAFGTVPSPISGNVLHSGQFKKNETYYPVPIENYSYPAKPQPFVIQNGSTQDVLGNDKRALDGAMSCNTFTRQPAAGLVTNTLHPPNNIFPQPSNPLVFLPLRNNHLISLPVQSHTNTSHLNSSMNFGGTSVHYSHELTPLISCPHSVFESGKEELCDDVVSNGARIVWSPNSHNMGYEFTSNNKSGFELDRRVHDYSQRTLLLGREEGNLPSLEIKQDRDYKIPPVDGLLQSNVLNHYAVDEYAMLKHSHISERDATLSFSHSPETISETFQSKVSIPLSPSPKTIDAVDSVKDHTLSLFEDKVVTSHPTTGTNFLQDQPDIGCTDSINDDELSHSFLSSRESCSDIPSESENTTTHSQQDGASKYLSIVNCSESLPNGLNGTCHSDSSTHVTSVNSVLKSVEIKNDSLRDNVSQTDHHNTNCGFSHSCTHGAFPSNIDIHVHPTINIPNGSHGGVKDRSVYSSNGADEKHSPFKMVRHKRNKSARRPVLYKNGRYAASLSSTSNDADDSATLLSTSSYDATNHSIDTRSNRTTSSYNSIKNHHKDTDYRYILRKIEKTLFQITSEQSNSSQINGVVKTSSEMCTDNRRNSPQQSEKVKRNNRRNSPQQSEKVKRNKTSISQETMTRSSSTSSKSHVQSLQKGPTSRQNAVLDSENSDSNMMALLETLKIFKTLNMSNDDSKTKKKRTALKQDDCQRLLQVLNHFESRLSSQELKVVKEDLHNLSLNLSKQLKSNRIAVREEIENRSKLFTSERFTMGNVMDLKGETPSTGSESKQISTITGKNSDELYSDKEKRAEKSKSRHENRSNGLRSVKKKSKKNKERHLTAVSNSVTSSHSDLYLGGLNGMSKDHFNPLRASARLFLKETELLRAHDHNPSPPLIISNVEHLGITFPQTYTTVSPRLDHKHSFVQMIRFLSEETKSKCPLISLHHHATRNVLQNPLTKNHNIPATHLVSDKAIAKAANHPLNETKTREHNNNNMSQHFSNRPSDNGNSDKSVACTSPSNTAEKKHLPSRVNEVNDDLTIIPNNNNAHDRNICYSHHNATSYEHNSRENIPHQNTPLDTAPSHHNKPNKQLHEHIEHSIPDRSSPFQNDNILSVTSQSHFLTTPESKPRPFIFSDLDSAFSPIHPNPSRGSQEDSLVTGDEIACDATDYGSDVTEPASVAIMMENDSQHAFQMDQEFDKHLADMKPYVLKLPHKSDRQKCAVWIKKLCEPTGPSISTRKTRNLHAQLMLQMLKKGTLSSPFDQKPAEGPLHPLPSYVAERIPDWVEGELGDTMGSSSAFPRSLGNPAATSTWVSGIGDLTERPHSSMGHTLDKDPSLSPIRHPDMRRTRGYSADDMSLEVKRSPSPPRHRPMKSLPLPDREKRQLPDVKAKGSRDDGTRQQQEVNHNDTDWTKPYNVSMASSVSLPKGTTFYDDTTSYHKPADREVAVRTKMIEAKFHEEKLKLQQKHDAAVQKILDRKNAEIEDVKNHYRSKSKDMEETNGKLEKKVQTLLKEVEYVTQNKDKQIAEMKKMSEDSNETRRNEFEKRLNDVMAEFEQDKFDMQKQHTQNIQEILDDTNSRLQRMESEYSHQTTTTTNVIKELESRVQHLMTEVDSTLNQRSAVEKERNDAYSRLEKLNEEHERIKERSAQMERQHHVSTETQEHNLRSLKNKTEASLEFLKQENAMAASKAADTIKELEDKVDQLKKAVKETEEQKHRQIREVEQVHQQDKLHLENLHDKQVRNMKKEIEQQDSDWNKKLAKMEKTIKEREEDITKLKEQKQQQAIQSEQALEEFKLQVEKNQTRIYDEMKQQMDQVESDLSKSKQAREKQAKEFARQMEEANFKQQHEIAELKMNGEAEKSQLMREFHVQKEFIISEHDKEVDNLKDVHRAEAQALEARLKERQDKADKTSQDSERVVRELREELVQANQLRKQQLVELGLLREEEKQKVHRDHEAEMARQRTELEQQRLEVQKSHGVEMEAVLEKTNERLKSIEKDYADRGAKSAESIAELQNVVLQLRGDIKKSRENSDEKLAELKHQYEEEKHNLRKQYSHNLATIQKEVEANRNRSRNLERQIQTEESDHEEKLTQLQLQCEEKMRGLLSADVKQELESTITSLKAQVSSLQQRSLMLQEELDAKNRNALGPFGNRTSSPIKSSV